MVLGEYQIEFTEPCLDKMARIEKLPYVHEAFEAVKMALSKNPYAFKSCLPLAELRYAKTKLYVRNNCVVPPMIFYFKIVEDDKLVRVFSVEQDSGFGDLDL